MLELFVSLNQQTICLEDGGDIIFKAPVVIGAVKNETPMIVSVVENIVINPGWTPPPRLASRSGIKYMPPGPNNPMGIVKFIFKNDHYILIHGTDKPELTQILGDRKFSNGCIRLNNDDAKILANIIAKHLDIELDWHAKNRWYRVTRSIPINIGEFYDC